MAPFTTKCIGYFHSIKVSTNLLLKKALSRCESEIYKKSRLQPQYTIIRPKQGVHPMSDNTSGNIVVWYRASHIALENISSRVTWSNFVPSTSFCYKRKAKKVFKNCSGYEIFTWSSIASTCVDHASDNMKYVTKILTIQPVLI